MARKNKDSPSAEDALANNNSHEQKATELTANLQGLKIDGSEPKQQPSTHKHEDEAASLQSLNPARSGEVKAEHSTHPNREQRASNYSDVAANLRGLNIDSADSKLKAVNNTNPERQQTAHKHKDGSTSTKKHEPASQNQHVYEKPVTRSKTQAAEPLSSHLASIQRSPAETGQQKAGKVPRTSSMRDPKQFLLPRPVPTPAYLQRAQQPPLSISVPKRLLVILDLNGTLVHRNSRTANSSFTKRPFCKDFIKYVMTEHDVMIWSSAREHNVERLCRSIYEEVQIAPPIHRWHREHFNLPPYMFQMNVQLYKQLTWVWNDPRIRSTSIPFATFDQTNTVLIDDSAEKALSEPYNLVRVDEYNGTDLQSDVLGKVVEYLEEARRTSDVSAFIRNKPFSFNSSDAPYTWTKKSTSTIQSG